MENTLLILRGLAIPFPMSGGKADGQGGDCPTLKDEEGIFHCNIANVVSYTKHW